MSKLKTILGSVAAAAVLAAGIAYGEGMPSLAGPKAPAGSVSVQMVVQTKTGYMVGSPEGWTVITPDGLDYVFLAPDGSAFCLSNSADVPDLAGIANSDLQAALSAPLGPEFWDSNFFDGMANKKYLHVGADANHPGGWPVQTVEATADVDIDGRSIPATLAGIMTFKSGSVYQVMCIASTVGYDAAKPSFNAVLQSFKVTKP
jgi:hypothetical protein